MKIMPALAEVKKIASEAKYNVLPVSFEMLSDFITPIETMRILKNVSTHCYMLESAQANETWGRYTFLGFDPKLEITCINGEMKIGNLKVTTEHPSDYLRQILADYKSPRFDYLPSFTGGLVGYFSYDYLGYSEPGVKCDVEDTENFKDLDLMLFDKVIAFDHLRQKIILIVNMPLADVEEIEAANELKPEYIGFVFAPKSRRYVKPETAAELKKQLSGEIQAAGVFVNESVEKIVELLDDHIIDIAQLHGDEDEDYIKRLRQLTGKPIIKAFQVKSEKEIA
jgi:anthranilate/para-aminobenzoate synthase component I